MNSNIKYDFGYEEWKRNRSPLQDNSIYQYLKNL